MGDPEMRDDRLKVGVVGAGPWATLVHAPMIAASEQTELSGVWARRPEAASNLAGAHGTTACAPRATSTSSGVSSKLGTKPLMK